MMIRPLALAALLAASLPCQLQRVSHPLTGRPTDAFVDLSGVFWATFPDGTLGVIFQGSSLSSWFEREGWFQMNSAFGLGQRYGGNAWSHLSLGVNEVYAMYEDGIAPGSHIMVRSEYSCSGLFPVVTATPHPPFPMPGNWSGADGSTGICGYLEYNRCLGIGMTRYAVFNHEPSPTYTPGPTIQWTYVRLTVSF